MNPGFAWIFYFVDNGPRNFMDSLGYVLPALGGVPNNRFYFQLNYAFFLKEWNYSK